MYDLLTEEILMFNFLFKYNWYLLLDRCKANHDFSIFSNDNRRKKCCGDFVRVALEKSVFFSCHFIQSDHFHITQHTTYNYYILLGLMSLVVKMPCSLLNHIYVFRH